MAGLDAVVFDQRMGQTVGPVGQFLIGALAAIADQRDPIAPAFFDDTVGQFDRRVQIFRILKLGPVEQEFRPLLERWQISPREIVDMTGGAKDRPDRRIGWEFDLTFPSPLALLNERLEIEYRGRPAALPRKSF